jgi:hypothetical protein
MRKESERAARRLTKQSKKASHELTMRGEKITQDLVKRSQTFTQELAERNGRAWTIVGFGVGLISASAIAYVFISKRVRRQGKEDEADQHILLSPNGYQNLSSGTGSSTAEQNGTIVQVITPVRQEAPEPAVPADAALVGVVSTQRYYPVETPLTQLQQQAGKKDEPVDIIYFGSEEEARAQGFSAASEGTKNSES